MVIDEGTRQEMYLGLVPVSNHAHGLALAAIVGRVASTCRVPSSPEPTKGQT